MPYTKVEIINQGLSRLNDINILTANELETSTDKPARLARTYWEINKELILRSHYWNFAETRAELSADSVSPTFGYAYQYPLPVDCVRVWSVNEVDIEVEQEHHWKIARKAVLSDEATCKIVYGANVGIELFDALAAKCLSLMMAVDLAYAISGQQGKGQEIAQELEAILKPLAFGIDSQEGNPKKKDRRRTSRWYAARYKGSYTGI